MHQAEGRPFNPRRMLYLAVEMPHQTRPLTPEQFLLTLLAQIAIVAVLATMLVRFPWFRRILLTEKRDWPERREPGSRQSSQEALFFKAGVWQGGVKLAPFDPSMTPSIPAFPLTGKEKNKGEERCPMSGCCAPES